jgi:hypothetical protein
LKDLRKKKPHYAPFGNEASGSILDDGGGAVGCVHSHCT